MEEEIKERIAVGNKAFFAIKNIFQSKTEIMLLSN